MASLPVLSSRRRIRSPPAMWASVLESTGDPLRKLSAGTLLQQLKRPESKYWLSVSKCLAASPTQNLPGTVPSLVFLPSLGREREPWAPRDEFHLSFHPALSLPGCVTHLVWASLTQLSRL